MTALSLRPDWPAADGVRALVTDAPDSAELPSRPRLLTQVHGPLVVNADDATPATEADACWTATPGVVCGVRSADCLPALFADRDGRFVAAAHAGWRGMCSGVLDLTVQRFFELDVPPADILVWLGPAISAAAYEVDAPVRNAFAARLPDCADAFAPGRTGHWHFDLYAAARIILAAQGVTAVHGGGFCTFSDERFPSYRRDPGCGRLVSLIWIQR